MLIRLDFVIAMECNKQWLFLEERDSKYNSSTNEVEQEARTFKYAKYLTYFKYAKYFTYRYRDRKLSIKFKYKSQPNKFKRKDKSLEDLGESLQKQVDKLKISQNGNVKLKTVFFEVYFLEGKDSKREEYN